MEGGLGLPSGHDMNSRMKRRYKDLAYKQKIWEQNSMFAFLPEPQQACETAEKREDEEREMKMLINATDRGRS